MRQRLTQADVSTTPSLEHRVREHQLAVPGPDVELDHVDPDLDGGIERGQGVCRRQRAGAAVTNPFAR